MFVFDSIGKKNCEKVSLKEKRGKNQDSFFFFRDFIKKKKKRRRSPGTPEKKNCGRQKDI